MKPKKASKRELKEDIGFLYLAVDGVSRKEWEETVLKFVCKNISQELKRERLKVLKEVEQLLPYGVGFTDRFYKLKGTK